MQIRQPTLEDTGAAISLWHPAGLTEAESWLREKGAVNVQLMVRSTNSSVLGFYDHLGYEDAEVEVVG